jgi:large subunit ribosomal protein L16
MGKGKGKPESWVAPVKAGAILFEISHCFLTKEQENVLKIVRRKLSVKTKLITRW